MKQLIPFLLVILLFSCKTAQEKFQSGDYNGAYSITLSDIKKGKNKEKNTALLNRSLEKLLDQHISEFGIPEEVQKDNLTSAIKHFNESQDLVNKYDKAISFVTPKLTSKFEILKSQNNVLKKEIGIFFSNSGQDKLEASVDTQDKKQAQDAKLDFDRAIKYLGKTDELERLVSKCYEYGTVIISIRMDYYPIDYSTYEVNYRFRKLTEEGNDFTKIYFESPVDEKVDCDVYIKLGSISYYTNESNNTQDFSNEIITGYKVTTDTSGYSKSTPIKETVYGRVTTITKKVTATSSITLDVYTASNYCTLRSDYFTHSVYTDIQEYHISGDERAIPSQYKQNSYPFQKTNDELKNELLDEFYRRIRNNF